MKVQRAIVISIFSGLFFSNTVLAAQALQLPSDMHNEKHSIPTENNVIASEHAMNKSINPVAKFYLKKLVIENKFITSKDMIRVKKICDKYENKNVDINNLYEAVFEITSYFRENGFPAATAYLPPQQSTDGTINLCVELGKYGKVTILNNSYVNDGVINSLTYRLHIGDIIKSRKLETVLNNIIDLGGVNVGVTLTPHEQIGESELVIRIKNGKSESYNVYSENHGSKSSGRYRYGIVGVFNELQGNGDKLTVNANVSNQKQHNYGIQYEQNIGIYGSKLGISLNKTDYELGSKYASMGAVGNASTISIYGVTPFYKTSSANMEINYGWDYRDLKDEMREFDYKIEKHSNVFHLGISGSKLFSKTNINYDSTLYVGNLIADKAHIGEIPLEIANTGTYKKGIINVNLLHGFNKQFDLFLRLQAQKSANNLDSSEQFYLGGANGVRAYPQGEGSGDEGYQATAELRYHTMVPGLSLSTYFDIGHVKYSKDSKIAGGTTLKGYGIATTWNNSDGYWLRIDYARRAGLANDVTEDAMSKQRLWFTFAKSW